MKKISNAILSVYDKRGLTAFASELQALGVNIYSSGGTFTMLKEADIEASKIEEYTGFPEMMDGRVKTLNPKVHGGILAKRDSEKHMASAKEHNIELFDMVVVNLYPFREAVENRYGLEKIIENIDIGGPSMVRSAAKNFNDVVIVTSPDDYYLLIEEMKKNDGAISKETRFKLARKAFSLTAQYDGFISSYFSTIDENGEQVKSDPDILTLQFEKKADLRYGENPHQKGAVYLDSSHSSGTVARAKQLSGKQLSFNNYLDLESATNMVFEFEEPAAVILKHNTPCGAATGSSLAEAYESALECDPLSAYGSIVGFNQPVDEEAALLLKNMFTEAIIAPSFTEEALAVLQKKKNLRLLELGTPCLEPDMDWEIKKISGGLLLEDRDRSRITADQLRVVTEKQPSKEEIDAMLFGQRIVKHVKSNAIVLVKGTKTIGIGAGQMSRVDALDISIRKSNSDITGAVMASDAFFPFRDSIDRAKEAGVTAIIQPGGSIRDEEVIEACNEHGIAMVFTDIRNFRHL